MTDGTKRRSQRKKYTRPNNPINVRLSDDDKRMLLEIYRHDFIDTRGLANLMAHRSYDKIQRRLMKLVDAHYIDIISQMKEVYVPDGGSIAYVYFLDNRGMKLLGDEFALPHKFSRIRERAKRIKTTTIEHDLEQARFMVTLRRSVETKDGFEFLYPEQIYRQLKPEILQWKYQPRILTPRVKWFNFSGEQGTKPDGFFMLYRPHAPEGRQRKAIFLEIDRGTETVNPTDEVAQSLAFWQSSSILRKCVVYANAFRRGYHTEQFGITSFQVLFVTTTQEHVEEMQQMYRQRLAIPPHEVHPNRFLFTHQDAIAAHGTDYATLPLQNAAGEKTTLI